MQAIPLVAVIKCKVPLLFARLRANLLVSSFSWVSLLSLLSLISYVGNIVNSTAPGADHAFASVLFLQAISGAVATLVSILGASSGRLRFQSEPTARSLLDFLTYGLIIIAIWAVPMVGIAVAACYLSAIGAIMVFNGASTLQLPIYIIISLSYSLQLLAPNPSISLLYVKFGLMCSLFLLAASEGRVPTPASLARGSLTRISAGTGLHALALSLTAVLNILFPLLIYGQVEYAKQLNLMLRACFVAETILLGKVIHGGQISYAFQQKSIRYKLSVLFILFSISILAFLLPFIVGKFHYLSILSVISAFSDQYRQMLIRGVIIVVACTFSSFFRLFYAFIYYRIGSLTLLLKTSDMSLHADAEPSPKLSYSLIYFAIIGILLTCLCFNPTWLLRTLLLPSFFLSSLLYVFKQAAELDSRNSAIPQGTS